MTEMLDQKNEDLNILNLIVIFLSIYVLGALTIDSLFILPSQTSVLLNYIDNTICLFFFFEFCYRFKKAKNKFIFMRWGWIDLISCIPIVDFLRAGRILRLIRLFRINLISIDTFLTYIFATNK